MVTMPGRLLLLVAFLLSACHSADQSPTSAPSGQAADQSGDGLSFYFQYFDNFAVSQIGDIIQLTWTIHIQAETSRMAIES
jgi:hypothetical protein